MENEGMKNWTWLMGDRLIEYETIGMKDGPIGYEGVGSLSNTGTV